MRPFRRKRKSRRAVSRTERAIGVFLLVLLPAIAGGIYYKGQHYDPGLYAFDPAARGSDSRGSAVLPVDPPSDGWRPSGEIERFRADNLYVKIDGRADQYLAYDVVGLETMTFAETGHAGRLIDVFVYDMGDPANAFGIFAGERASGIPLPLGRDGYRSQSSVFFFQGRCYVQVLPSEPGEEMERTAVSLARALASRIPDDGTPLWGMEAFPKDGMVPNSLQYLKHDALSLDFLSEVYVAKYRESAGETTAFLTRRKTGRETSELYGRYLDYLRRYGRVLSQSPDATATFTEGEIGGAYEAIFRKGEVFGGVTGANGPEIARNRMRILVRDGR